MRSDGLDRGLPVGCGVADVVRRGRGDGGKAARQRGDYFARVVDRQRGLRHIGERVGVGRIERLDIRDRLHHPYRARGQLAQRAQNLGMAGVADHHDQSAALVVDQRLAMHLCDQRACGVDADKATRRRGRRHGPGHAVGRKNNRGGAVRHLVEFVDEHGALGLQALDDEFIVNDLVPHIDGGAEFPERALHRVDGAHDPGAKAARRAEIKSDRRLAHGLYLGDGAPWRKRLMDAGQTAI